MAFEAPADEERSTNRTLASPSAGVCPVGLTFSTEAERKGFPGASDSRPVRGGGAASGGNRAPFRGVLFDTLGAPPSRQRSRVAPTRSPAALRRRLAANRR